MRNTDRVYLAQVELRVFERFAHDGHNPAKMFARGEFRHDAAILAVNVDLRSDDAGKNFASREFRQYATTIATVTKSVPVEAHWSISIVERAHPLL